MLTLLAALVPVLQLQSILWAQEPIWQLTQSRRPIHRFSTLFTAQDVRRFLSSQKGLNQAVDWCKKTAVTKVYIECYRDGYQAEREALLNAKKRFADEGIEASGCVTTTKIGKPSTGWKSISCYTDMPTQEKLQAIFEYAASMFDEVMIDDFWFTDCTCPECDAARLARTATVGQKKYPVAGDTWEDYHCELMVELSRDRVLAPAKKVNPKARLIIKYPQWYDQFHERGYEVVRETADFDRTWVGTESRDYTDQRWGGTPQYESYFIMRWLGGIGGEKCGGGWYDPYGTTQPTYVEQARQTVLAGARESMLFCYGSLQQAGGAKNVQALRPNLPELFAVAEQVAKRQIVGIAAYKPPNSHPDKEPRVFDFVGMMGLPLVPCHEFPSNAPAAFFSIHALKDADLAAKLSAFIAAGKPVLLTDGLAKKLEGKVKLDAANVKVLAVNGDPKSLLTLGQEQVDAIRVAMNKPFNVVFTGPNRMGFYLFADGSVVVENFTDEPAAVTVNGPQRTVAARGWMLEWK